MLIIVDGTRHGDESKKEVKSVIHPFSQAIKRQTCRDCSSKVTNPFDSKCATITSSKAINRPDSIKAQRSMHRRTMTRPTLIHHKPVSSSNKTLRITHTHTHYQAHKSSSEVNVDLRMKRHRYGGQPNAEINEGSNIPLQTSSSPKTSHAVIRCPQNSRHRAADIRDYLEKKKKRREKAEAQNFHQDIAHPKR